MHCVPGGSLFSGEYDNYGIWSHVFLCLYASGQKLALRLKSDLLVFPNHQIKINQEDNEKILWATSSTYNCNLLVCSLHLSGAPFLYKALTALINEHTFLVFGLLLLSSEIQQTLLLKWHYALHVKTHEGKVSFLKKNNLQLGFIQCWLASPLSKEKKMLGVMERIQDDISILTKR